MPRIVIVYQGVFQYDALNVFAAALAEGFDALGFQTVVLDTKTDEAGSRARLGELLTRPERIAFILGPGAILADAAIGGENLYGRLGVPFVGFLVDHPSYALMRLAKARNALITCIDRGHIAFLEAVGLDRTAYVPHGASLPESSRPWAERADGIAFAASASDASALRDHVLAGLAPPQRTILADVADDPAMGTLDAVERAVRAHPGAAALGWGAGWPGPLIIFLNEADRVIRAIRRDTIVRALDVAGVALDLYGRGWDRFAFRSHRVHPPLPFDEMCEELQHYRYALHLNPLFSAGLHERICSAAIAGCAPITDGNAEIAAVYPDGAAALHFDPAGEGWAEALHARLDTTDAEPIAREARRVTARAHTWRHRAEEVARLVDAYWPERAGDGATT